MMTWRLLAVCAVLLTTLTGCAHNDSLVGRGGALFDTDLVSQNAHWLRRTFDTNSAPANRAVATNWATTTVTETAYYAIDILEEDGPYRLDTGDRLRIFVYGQPNLSRLYTIGHDGNISVPLIGRVFARGLTVTGLSGVIRRRLGSRYVRDPQVSIDVHQNRPFFILGEVRNAGQYPYVSGMTIETAIAIAGGYGERASRRQYRVTRRVQGITEHIDVQADHIVKPGDTVFVYERFF